MLRRLPPAGVPLEGRALFTALCRTLVANGTHERVLRTLESWLAVPYVYTVNSGRTALWVALRALHRLQPERNVVAIPAYTCFSVPAAVARAGLRILPVEIQPETLDFDYAHLESLPGKHLLCVVAGHLLGLVNDVPRIRRIATAKGAYVVDDAAQAMGATLQGQPAGTMGDVGIYSLGRGKALPAVEGGILVTRDAAIAKAIHAELVQLPPASWPHTVAVAAKMLTGALLLHPGLYWLPHSLPFLKLGVTEYDPDFPLARLCRVSAALLAEMQQKLERVNQIRRTNARALRAALHGSSSFQLPQPLPDSEPVYIRLPVLAAHQELRQAVLARLQAAGLGASGYYPSAVCDIAAARSHWSAPQGHCPVAESVARRVITLPTHPLVTVRDREAMIQILREF
jgi:perosamine synthetase